MATFEHGHLDSCKEPTMLTWLDFAAAKTKEVQNFFDESTKH